jgi:hypothetical protein
VRASRDAGPDLTQFIHWEGEPLECDRCGEALESEYGPVEEKVEP